MGKAEIIIFIILANIILLIFMSGIIAFVFQYRKRKLQHEKEKSAIEKQHRLDLLNNQLQIQQQTMQFIGSEIHDSVTQKLTLASIYSQRLEFENQYPAFSDKLKRISIIINDSLLELRDLSRTLTDNRLENVSLTELLHIECVRVNDTNICKAVLESGFDREISFLVKSFLLRVMQEFIQNSLKHSACSLIKIHLADTTGGLELNVSDNGKGFDCSNLQYNGIGLNNMKRRIALIGGTFNLQSEAGKGTSLHLFVENKNLMTE